MSTITGAPSASKYASRANSSPSMTSSTTNRSSPSTASGYIAANASTSRSIRVTTAGHAAADFTTWTPRLKKPTAGFTTKGARRRDGSKVAQSRSEGTPKKR